MQLEPQFVIKVLLALLTAIVLSYSATPLVTRLAVKIGAVDVPKDDRRMHDHPIPRMGGLAIFVALLVSVLMYSKLETSTRGILLGATIIVILGIADDKNPLPAWLKFLVQLIAAVVVVLHGVTIEAIANPFKAESFITFGVWSIPITILWLVGVTNSVNLIDGLDGLACGVSTIASVALLVIAVFEGENAESAIILAALTGACLGFFPANANPAKIFMGDTGALMLGFVLASVSVTGMFKFYTIMSFVVPFLAIGLPIADTVFAILRRLLKGQNPMHADRGHLHHRLIDLGFNQKQAVAVMYGVSAVLAFSAVYIATSATFRILIFVLAFAVLFIAALILAKRRIDLLRRIAKAEAEKAAAAAAEHEAALTAAEAEAALIDAVEPEEEREETQSAEEETEPEAVTVTDELPETEEPQP